MIKVNKLNILLLKIDIFLFVMTIFMNSTNISLSVLSWIVLSVSIYYILTLIMRDKKLVTPMILFMIMFSICMYGQPICKFIFEFETEKMIMNLFTEYQVFNAMKLSLQCHIMLHLGSIIPNKNRVEVYNDKDVKLKSLKITGIILLIISTLPAIYIYITKFKTMGLYGYQGIFETMQLGVSSIISKLSVYFTLSIFILTIAYKNKKILIFGIIYIGSQMLFGSRGVPILTIICLLIAYNYGVEKFNKRDKIIFFLGAILVVNILTIISILRIYPLSTWSSNYNAIIGDLNIKNPLLEVIIEMGAAIAPTIYSLKLVPEIIPIKFGITYICSVLLVVPDILRIRPAIIVENAQIDQLVASYAGMPFGGSLVEEAYINFVFFAPVVFLVIGYAVGKFSIKYINSKSPVFIAYSSYMMIYITWILRNVSNDFFQNTMYYVIIPWVLYKIIEGINITKMGLKKEENK